MKLSFESGEDRLTDDSEQTTDSEENADAGDQGNSSENSEDENHTKEKRKEKLPCKYGRRAIRKEVSTKRCLTNV